MKRFILSLTLVGTAFLYSGCICHESTVTHRDVERVKVEFENESAARIFYEKLSHIPVNSRKESSTEFSIPVVFEWKQKVETGDNERFNEAVYHCDTNKDGRITESEAKIFAAH